MYRYGSETAWRFLLVFRSRKITQTLYLTLKYIKNEILDLLAISTRQSTHISQITVHQKLRSLGSDLSSFSNKG